MADTAPKPFVFVLMPFDEAFKDLYNFGIKGAASDTGAYAERLDEQMFVEGMLEQIFNQISKADVLVADMTGRNANVFYEVGYAHALDRVVLLLTRDPADIPFDLKHRPHIVYKDIGDLRAELAKRLPWAIEESRRRRRGATGSIDFELRLFSTVITPRGHGEPLMLGVGVPFSEKAERVEVQLDIRNIGVGVSEPISHIYLFADARSALIPFYPSPDGAVFYSPSTRGSSGVPVLY